MAIGACSIVNANDFGLTEGISAGILDAHRAGVVTATSAMVTTQGAGDALARLGRTSIDVGLHVDLLAGAPLTDGASVRDRRTGRFWTLPQLAARAVMGRLREREIADEIRAQLRRLTNAGLRVTHLDSHRHTHLLPPVWRAINAVAAEAGHLTVRRPRERIASGGRRATDHSADRVDRRAHRGGRPG